MEKLSRDEKLIRANEILNKTELKQAICNQILGCTHKDVERAMQGIVKEKQITEAQAEQLELEALAPEKFDADFQFMINKEHSDIKKHDKFSPLTREGVAALLAASRATYEPPVKKPTDLNYSTYSREQIEVFMKEYFDYKDKHRKSVDEWNSQKTKELEEKIVITKKQKNSTKA